MLTSPHRFIEPLEHRIAPASSGAFNLSALDGLSGFQMNGAAALDQTGFSISDAGDVNGDGFGDLIVGAPAADPNGSSSGETYVVFGKAKGFAPEFDLSGLNGINGFKIRGGTTNYRIGYSVSGGGDINGDGFDDLIVAADSASYNGSNSGSVYVIFGKSGAFAQNFLVSTLNGANGFRLDGAAAYDHAAVSVSRAGDVNGDGFDDILVGASRANSKGPFTGAAFLIFGKSSGFAPSLKLSALNGVNGFRLAGVAGTKEAGNEVSAAGDVNGDGFGDLLISGSEITPDPFKSYAGGAYIVFGKVGGFTSNFELSSLNGANGFRILVERSGDRLGSSLSDAGDINGDGYDDVILSTPSADSGAFT